MALGIALGLCFIAGPLPGQETRAIVTGSVTDPQGAVVPNAKIEIKNMETNVATTVLTNESGFYSSPPINPGQYTVGVSATGFKTIIQSNIELRVSDRLALDFHMQLGGTSETVNVTAEAPMLETSTASQSSTINRDLVANIPTYARNVFELVRYTAGVQGGRPQHLRAAALRQRRRQRQHRRRQKRLQRDPAGRLAQHLPRNQHSRQRLFAAARRGGRGQGAHQPL